VARLRQAFRPGAYFPLPQTGFGTGFGMDHVSGASPRAGRPVDVAGGGRFHPAQAGAGVRCGSAAALGAPLHHRPTDTDSGPPRRFSAFGGTRHARQATETLREIARKAQRPLLGPSQTLPGPQKGRLSPRRQQTRSFAMDIKLIAKLLVVKTQAKYGSPLDALPVLFQPSSQH
jgi:hypothetical protein